MAHAGSCFDSFSLARQWSFWQRAGSNDEDLVTSVLRSISRRRLSRGDHLQEARMARGARGHRGRRRTGAGGAITRRSGRDARPPWAPPQQPTDRQRPAVAETTLAASGQRA
eukprot:gene17586-biopygen3867